MIQRLANNTVKTALQLLILAEIAVAEPSTGAFSQYADKYLGPTMGFVTGWMYWSSGILGMATETTAAALLSLWWYPQVQNHYGHA